MLPAIGGYVPVKGRRHRSHRGDLRENEGLETRTFPRKPSASSGMGTAQRGVAARQLGAKDYAIGNHPLWEQYSAASIK